MESQIQKDYLAPNEISKIKDHKLKKYAPSTCIEKYSYLLIRPPRMLYNVNLLNPSRKYGGKYTLQTYQIPFDLSLYLPRKCRYVVLYLHGNSSSRIQGYKHLKFLPMNVGLACFDFNGCGLRTENKYITLGKTEAADVDTAYRFLKQKGYTVAGWGRSMGAVSLLLSTECKVLIVDSPFSSLKSVCKEMAQTECSNSLLCLLHCCFPCMFWMVGKDISSKCGLDTNQLQIIDQVIKMNAKRSIAFIAAKDDTVVNFNHSKLLHDSFKGKKSLIICEGRHNTVRPVDTTEKVLEFIENQLFSDKQGEDILKQSPISKRKLSQERQVLETHMSSYTNLISGYELKSVLFDDELKINTQKPRYATTRA